MIEIEARSMASHLRTQMLYLLFGLDLIKEGGLFRALAKERKNV
jgi:hypothetical protein